MNDPQTWTTVWELTVDAGGGMGRGDQREKNWDNCIRIAIKRKNIAKREGDKCKGINNHRSKKTGGRNTWGLVFGSTTLAEPFRASYLHIENYCCVQPLLEQEGVTFLMC